MLSSTSSREEWSALPTLLYVWESVPLIVITTLSSLFPRSPAQLVRYVPPSSCSLYREKFKGKVSNSILRWIRWYFFLSFKAAELFSLASSQRNQTEELHITLKSSAWSVKILSVRWIQNSVVMLCLQEILIIPSWQVVISSNLWYIQQKVAFLHGASWTPAAWHTSA